MSKFAPNIVVAPDSDHEALVPPRLLVPPSSPVALSSMLGHPGSEPENCVLPSADENGLEPKTTDDLKTDISRILLNVKHRSFQDMIMHEKLDETDTVYMDGECIIPPTMNAH